MAPYYRALTAAAAAAPLALDPALLEKLEKANEEELRRLDERLVDAEKTEGETEIADALKARATYLTRIGDKASGGPFLSSGFVGYAPQKMGKDSLVERVQMDMMPTRAHLAECSIACLEFKQYCYSSLIPHPYSFVTFLSSLQPIFPSRSGQ